MTLSPPNESQLTLWLSLAFNPQLTPLQKQHLLERHDSIEACVANSSTIAKASLKKKHARCYQKIIDESLTWLNQSPQHHILVQTDADYPQLLKQTHTPPLVLFVQGQKSILASPQIALVGSRKPTPVGQKTALQFAEQLAIGGLTITSGLAYGIDAKAHQGALHAQGNTIAVLGSGLQRIYPKAHALLAEKIAQSGALVSEFPLNSPPKPYHFPQRNRIISGLSLGTLIIEAQLKSGSLITAQYALEQNRPVFAIPGSIYNDMAQGCHYLIQQGAILTFDFNHIINEIQPNLSSNLPANLSLVSPENQIKLDQKHRTLLKYIDFALTSVSELEQSVSFTSGEINSILSFLELNGYITKFPGGYIRVK